jgi:chromosome segregation ATPase
MQLDWWPALQGTIDAEVVSTTAEATMRCAPVLVLMAVAAAAQAPSPESQATQALLAEVRQLRQDLYATATTIQRVQIVMYRLQAEGAELNRAAQRLDEARVRCSQTQMQRKWLAAQIQMTEGRRRDSQNAADQKAAEAMLVQLKSNDDALTDAEQQCRPGEIDAETQLRAEQAKMNELQDKLDKLDRALAGLAGYGESPGRGSR